MCSASPPSSTIRCRRQAREVRGDGRATVGRAGGWRRRAGRRRNSCLACTAARPPPARRSSSLGPSPIPVRQRQLLISILDLGTQHCMEHAHGASARRRVRGGRFRPQRGADSTPDVAARQRAAAPRPVFVSLQVISPASLLALNFVHRHLGLGPMAWVDAACSFPDESRPMLSYCFSTFQPVYSYYC
jgi:hypothetical protein